MNSGTHSERHQCVADHLDVFGLVLDHLGEQYTHDSSGHRRRYVAWLRSKNVSPPWTRTAYLGGIGPWFQRPVLFKSHESSSFGLIGACATETCTNDGRTIWIVSATAISDYFPGKL